MSLLTPLWVSATTSFVVPASLAAVTVTVWAVSQLIGVKISGLGAALTSVPACPPMEIVTFAVGWLSRTTV